MTVFHWNSLWAFILVFPLILAIFFSVFKQKKGSFFYSHLAVFSKPSSSLRVQLIFLPFVLKVLSLLFLIIALARPQVIESISQQTQDGLDIMITMDTSLSMLVEDMDNKSSVTRLTASKNVVQQFIKGRLFDRIGLIAFAGESFTKVPLTYDYKLLKKSLSQLNIDTSIKQGTAIGVALANSLARLKSSPEKSRIIIFLTDGENNTGFIDPETALNLIKENNIKVYTVGLGQRNGTFFIKYKSKDMQGRPIYMQNRIRSHINKKLLQKIATETGGKFFMANSLQNLKEIFNQIDKLETYEIKTNQFTLYEEHFQDFLWPGFILYLVSVFLSLSIFFKGI